MTTTAFHKVLGWWAIGQRKKDASGRSAAAELTGGGKGQIPWKLVYTAANRTEAEVIRARLESEEIPVLLAGEAIGIIYGLTTGPLAQVSIMVPAPLAERARGILEGNEEADNFPSNG